LPPGHRHAECQSLSVSELADEAFVSAVHRERGGLARRVTDLCLSRGFVPKLASVISRKTSMLTLVAEGFGLAEIPACMTVLFGTGVPCLPLPCSRGRPSLRARRCHRARLARLAKVWKEGQAGSKEEAEH